MAGSPQCQRQPGHAPADHQRVVTLGHHVLGAIATAAMFDLADIGLALAGGLLALGLAWQTFTETSSPGVAARPQGDAASLHRTSTGGRG